MIVGIVATPNLTFLDMIYSSGTFGFKFLHFNQRYPKHFKVIKPIQTRVYLETRPVFLDSFTTLSSVYLQLQNSCDNYLILVGGNPVDHYEYDLLAYYGCSITPADLYAIRSDSRCRKPKQVRRIIDEVVKNIGSAGILQNIYPQFYREKDKGKRAELQRKVYDYMLGKRKTPPATTINRLKEVLMQDDTQKLRSAAIYAMAHGIDEAAAKFDIDTFEISFLLSKRGKP